MNTLSKTFRNYLSLILLFIPAILFLLLIILFKSAPQLAFTLTLPFMPWQFWGIILFGIIATTGGVLDWRYHRNPLNLKIPKKEREAEAFALGAGGVPMFLLMCFATFSNDPKYFLIPIIIVLIYTTVAICYDEFIFHIKRCTKIENIYHRMLVYGNGLSWLCWFHFIYCK